MVALGVGETPTWFGDDYQLAPQAKPSVFDKLANVLVWKYDLTNDQHFANI